MKKYNERNHKSKVIITTLFIAVTCLFFILLAANGSDPGTVKDDTSSTTKIETKDKDINKEEVKEDMTEPEEQEDTDNSSNIDLNTIDATIEQILKDNYDSSNYKVEFNREDSEVYIGIMAYDVNLTGIPNDQIQQLIRESNLDTTHDSLAQSIKNAYYSKANTDVTVTIGLFDINGTMFYSVTR